MNAPTAAGPKVAARILCAHFPCLGREVARAVRAGADWIHADVTEDTPGLTAAPVVAALHRVTHVPVDVHLLVKPTDALLSAFAKAAADVVTFHPEATEDVRGTVLRAKAFGLKVGLALTTMTPLSVLDSVIDSLDVVMIAMAAELDCVGRPGLPPDALSRIRAVRSRIAASGRPIALEVDGGVDAQNAAQVIRAGADVIVAGSALFGAGDYGALVAALKGRPAPLRDRARGEAA